MIAYIPLIFAILGLFIYLLVARADLKEIGRLVFFAGFLVFMFTLASETIRFLVK